MTWRELQEAVANEAARLGVSLDDVEVWLSDDPYCVLADVRVDLCRNDSPHTRRLRLPHIELLS